MHADIRHAYLAGLIDGDGYLKIPKSQKNGRAFYSIQVGIQQLWPGEAVRLFAEAFGGRVMKPMAWPGHRLIARCEVHTGKAEAALQSLLPYLLVKREQALLLVDLRSIQESPKRGSVTYSFPHRCGFPVIVSRRCFSPEQLEDMESVRAELIAIHEGREGPRRSRGVRVMPLEDALARWRPEETLAYLAGVMDSDGNFGVVKKRVPRMLWPHYRINIRAAQVAPSPAIELLAKTFGGNVTIRRARRPNHRDLVGWGLHDGRAAAAIKALYPYLVVKKHEAELLLELLQLKAQGKKGLTEWVHPNRWHPAVTMRKRCYTKEQVAEFERIHRTVQALHSGSTAADPSSYSLRPRFREGRQGIEAEA